MIIQGKKQCSLSLSDFVLKQDGDISLVVEISTNWYQAKVKFYSSFTRIKSFLEDLTGLLNHNNEQINYINEDGNFDLSIELDRFGNARIFGILSENMEDDLQLTYGFESDFGSLDQFRRQLQLVIISSQ